MELRHLRYFAMIVEARGFGRAAAQLRVAQPTLSRQIRELEGELGVTLLERHARGIALTAAGVAVHGCAVRTLEAVRVAVDRALAAANGTRGRCHIGAALTTVWTGTVSRGVAEIQRRYPEIDLVVQEIQGGGVQWAALAAGEIDIAVGVTPPATQTAVESALLYHDPVRCALLPASHPLASAAELTAHDLREVPLIELPPGLAEAGLMAPVEEALRRIGCSNRRVHSAQTILGVWHLVAAGQGWSLAPVSFLRRAPDGTRAVRLRGMHVPLSFSVAWRRGEDRPVVRNVRDVFIEQGAGAGSLSAGAGATRPPRRRADPSPEFRLLRTLSAVIADRSIGRAAARLGLTQPTVSRQIRDLENELGTNVVERRPRGVEPTAAGESLAADAPDVLKCVDDLLATAEGERSGSRGCALGVVTARSVKLLLDRLFQSVAERRLPIQVGIQEMPSFMQPTALLARTIDVGLAHALPPNPGEEMIARELLLRDEIDAALLARGHPLARRRRLQATELAQVPFLFMQRPAHPRFYDQMLDSLARAGLMPLIEGAYDGLTTVWSLALEGRGWAPGFRSQREHPPPGLVAIPIEGFSIPFGLEVLWRRDETRAAVLAVLDLVRMGGASIAAGT